jgi:steroid 5-alpha reductase family enzyme
MLEKTTQYSRSTSFIIVTVGYVMSVAIAYMVMDILGAVYHPIINAAIGDFVATVVIFIFSVRLKNSSMYDAYWSVIPPLIAIYFMVVLPDGNLMRQLLITSVVSFWAIRLTLNWAKGWPGLHHEDWRYGKLAEDTGKAYWLVSFLGIHLFPTVLVFLGCVPMYFAMASAEPLGIWDIVAALVAIIATIIEYVSDEQLRAFKSRVSDGDS